MNFKHAFLTYEPLQVDETSGERHYVLPCGAHVPSVTTVLGRLCADRLDDWRDRIGIEEVQKITRRAARRGTAVHEICERYLLNNERYKAGAMPINIDTFRSIRPFLDSHVDTILGLEAPLYSRKLGTAGRADCIAEWDGVLSILDFKTSMRPKKEDWILNYFLQATCYALMFEELFALDISQIVVIIAVDHDEPQVWRKSKSLYVDRVREIFSANLS